MKKALLCAISILSFICLSWASAQTANPQSAQLAAASSADKSGEAINVFSYLSPAQQIDIRTGAATLDVSKALQKAVDEANGRPLRLPTGTYRIDSSIEINNQSSTATTRPAAKICGDGIQKTIILNRADGYAFKSSATVQQAAARSLAHNGEICHLTISADNRSPAGAGGIKLESFWFGYIHSVEISAPKAHGIAMLLNPALGKNSDLYAVGNLRIEDTHVNGATHWGIYNDSPSNSLYLNENYITNNDLGGVYLSGTGNEIHGGAIAGNADGPGGVAGLKISSAISSPHNSRVFGVEFDNNYKYHAVLEGFHHTLEQNRFVQAATGGAFRTPVAILLDGTHSGYPQENRIEGNLFRFDSPGSAKITAISIPDSASGTGNRIVNSHFGNPLPPGLTKYAFAGSSRSQNYALENNLLVYGTAQLPYRMNAVAVASVGNNQLLTNAARKLTLNVKTIDTHGAFATATQRFTAPHSGVLKIDSNLVFRPVTAANVPTTIYVYKNGVAVHTIQLPRGFATVGADENYFFSVTLPTAKGDYFEIFGKVETANTLYSIGAGANQSTTFEML